MLNLDIASGESRSKNVNCTGEKTSGDHLSEGNLRLRAAHI